MRRIGSGATDGKLEQVLDIFKRNWTKQHSSRMRTVRLPTMHVLVATTRCQYHEGMGSQVSKFKQVTTDDRQMSIAGGGGRSHVCYLGGKRKRRSHIWYLGWGRGVTMSQCIMGTGHMGTPWTEWQADNCENITLPQICLWTVTNFIEKLQSEDVVKITMPFSQTGTHELK